MLITSTPTLSTPNAPHEGRRTSSGQVLRPGPTHLLTAVRPVDSGPIAPGVCERLTQSYAWEARWAFLASCWSDIAGPITRAQKPSFVPTSRTYRAAAGFERGRAGVLHPEPHACLVDRDQPVPPLDCLLLDSDADCCPRRRSLPPPPKARPSERSDERTSAR